MAKARRWAPHHQGYKQQLQLWHRITGLNLHMVVEHYLQVIVVVLVVVVVLGVATLSFEFKVFFRYDLNFVADALHTPGLLPEYHVTVLLVLLSSFQMTYTFLLKLLLVTKCMWSTVRDGTKRQLRNKSWHFFHLYLFR